MSTILHPAQQITVHARMKSKDKLSHLSWRVVETTAAQMNRRVKVVGGGSCNFPSDNKFLTAKLALKSV